MKKIVLALTLITLFAGCEALQQITATAPNALTTPNALHFTGGIPGFSFELVSCTGNASEGKVYLTFVYNHVLAPQKIAMPAGNGAYAVDYAGNRYSSSPFNGQYRNTQPYVPEKVVLEVRGVPPSVTTFSIIAQNFVSYTVDVSGSQKKTDLLFRNVPIVWE